MVEMQFDQWAKLFKEDPEAFDKMKQEMLDSLLQEFSDNGRSAEHIDSLRAMLWRQEQELKKFKDPTARLNKLIELFFVQHGKFAESINELTTLITNIQNGTQHHSNIQERDNIVQFKKP